MVAYLLQWRLSCRTYTIATMIAALGILYGHFLHDPGQVPMLQIAALYPHNVTFFTNLPTSTSGQSIQIRPWPDANIHNIRSNTDLFDETAWRTAFQHSTTTVPATSLQPQHCYTYQYHTKQHTLHGAFCTPPAPSSPTPSFRAMFGSCLAVNPIPPFHRLRAFEWAWSTLRPQVVFLLGDLVYTDVEETWLWFLRVPAKLAWYRTWQVPSLEKLLRLVPAVLMHDDHEIENGWDGSVLARHAAALKEMAFWTHGRKRQVWNYGKDVTVFVVDTRSFRHTGSILGDKQWGALEAWFNATSSATWRIVASPSLVASSLGTSLLDDGDGGWNLFPKDRDKLLALAGASTAAGTTVFLSGDVHWGLAVEHRLAGNRSVWEFGASPFQALPFPTPSATTRREGVVGMGREEEEEEVVHFLAGSGYYFGSFRYDERDASLTVCIQTTSMLTGETKEVYAKQLFAEE